MPNITSREELIAYFVEKSQRRAKEGGSSLETLNEILALLNGTASIAEIKSTVRNLHRKKLKEIQQTESIETRIELREQLAVYDDCLTQLRTVSI